jgi:hypothetical protein
MSDAAQSASRLQVEGWIRCLPRLRHLFLEGIGEMGVNNLSVRQGLATLRRLEVLSIHAEQLDMAEGSLPAGLHTLRLAHVTGRSLPEAVLDATQLRSIALHEMHGTEVLRGLEYLKDLTRLELMGGSHRSSLRLSRLPHLRELVSAASCARFPCWCLRDRVLAQCCMLSMFAFGFCLQLERLVGCSPRVETCPPMSLLLQRLLTWGDSDEIVSGAVHSLPQLTYFKCVGGAAAVLKRLPWLASGKRLCPPPTLSQASLVSILSLCREPG